MHARTHGPWQLLWRLPKNRGEFSGHNEGVEEVRWVRLESHFQSEREAPHQTCYTSAVVDTAQVNSDKGQLGLVLQCEVSDYWPDKQEGHCVRSLFTALVHRRVRIWHKTKKTSSKLRFTHTHSPRVCTLTHQNRILERRVTEDSQGELRNRGEVNFRDNSSQTDMLHKCCSGHEHTQ